MKQLGQLLPKLDGPLPGRVCAEAIELLAATECPALTARRARRAEASGAPHDPIVWSEAKGANVIDADGNIFVDLTSGFGACAIGHRHPRVVETVQRQTDVLLHALGDLHPSDVKIQLLNRLAHLAPFSDARVILGQNGADAVEAALKTAMRTTGNPGILAFQDGYHGLSYGALAVCGFSQSFRTPFESQLNPHVVFAPYPVLSELDEKTALSNAIKTTQSHWDNSPSPIGAVIIEPIVGRGGIIQPVAGFLQALSTLCRKRGAVLIIDEIFTGMGRCGANFLSQQQGVSADLICIGKALGGGLPISACIGKSQIMSAWGNPDQEALHTATFFGNPLACAAALTTLKVIEDEALCELSKEQGHRFLGKLKQITQNCASVLHTRGCGMMLGVTFRNGNYCLRVARYLLEKGYIAITAGSDARVLSITPPLNISIELIDGFLDTLSAALKEVA